jgi:RimJ/RimL family protein N-acetyltransferase
MVGLDAAGRPDGEVPSLSRDAEEACAAAAALHAQTGFEPPWTGYLAFDGERCVGTCAFKSPPRGNRVEIACYPFPAQEQHLEAMMASLMRIAFENHPGIRVIAHTLAEEGTETAVLARLGFHLTGRTQDTDQGEVWEWMLQTATS